MMTDEQRSTEETLASLANDRDKLLAQQVQQVEKGRVLAFDAHAGDVEASKKFQALQRDATWTQGQLVSISAAISEGERRLMVARSVEQKARDKAKAESLKPAWAKFREAGVALDRAMNELVAASAEAENALRELNAAGIRHPRREMLDTFGGLALESSLRKTLWRGRFSPVQPRDQRNFRALFDGWSVAIGNALSQLAGEQKAE